MSNGCLSQKGKPVASKLNKEPNEFQSTVFLATVREDALDISDGFKFGQEANMLGLGKSWKHLRIFVSVKHMKHKNRPSFISDIIIRNNRSVHLLSASTGKEF